MTSELIRFFLVIRGIGDIARKVLDSTVGFHSITCASDACLGQLGAFAFSWGHEHEIIGTREKNDEYTSQWVSIRLVENAVPLLLDARPVQKSDTRLEIVEGLLHSAQELVPVDNALMDRESDSQHTLEEISQRGPSYVVRNGCTPARRRRLSDHSAGR